LAEALTVLELTIALATPIVKAVLEKFYESAGEKLGEKAAELVPAKVKQLGQLVWDKYLRRKQGADEIVQNAANGSAEAQQALAEDLHNTLEADDSLKQAVQPLVTEIIQNIQNNVGAKNVQQIFGGQGLMVNAVQEQPIIQIQGNPTLHFGGKSKD
jgi:Asp-tRNA(Asn)/Glu-tRNA(Gln) amidotransferase B subunit